MFLLLLQFSFLITDRIIIQIVLKKMHKNLTVEQFRNIEHHNDYEIKINLTIVSLSSRINFDK